MASGRKTQLRVLQGFGIPLEERGHAALMTLVRISGRLHDAMGQVAEKHGLTLPHFEVLLCLRQEEGISQQQLCERLLVTKGNISIIVNKMETTGLIERRLDAEDQRLLCLYMTNEGRKMLARLKPDREAMLKKILGGFTLAEHKTLHELLLRMDAAFDPNPL